MTQTQQEIERLRTLQESYDELADGVNVQLPAISDKIDNIDLTPIENKVDEGVNTLSAKIDNIKLPEIDTTELAKEATLNEVSNKLDNINVEVDLSDVAKQGENQEATNTAIYTLLSQFGESVLQEAVTIVLNCAAAIVWSDYEVIVSTSSGNRIIPIYEDGTCTFSVKYGQEYSVFLPIIGSYIVPQKQTYTAQSPSKTIYWSYVMGGAFGIDELGRRYTTEEIEAYTDRSFIKFIGYTDEFLENYVRDDGRVGIGFILAFESVGYKEFASSDIEFSTQLLPFVTTVEEAELCADGEFNTEYILEEGMRLGVSTPAASYCNGKSIVVNNITKKGYMPSAIQVMKAKSNTSSIKRISELLGKSITSLLGANIPTSNQYNKTRYIYMNTTNNINTVPKTQAIGALVTFYALN